MSCDALELFQWQHWKNNYVMKIQPLNIDKAPVSTLSQGKYLPLMFHSLPVFCSINMKSTSPQKHKLIDLKPPETELQRTFAVFGKLWWRFLVSIHACCSCGNSKVTITWNEMKSFVFSDKNWLQTQWRRLACQNNELKLY